MPLDTDPSPPSPSLIGATLDNEIQQYLQSLANQLSYADAAEALGLSRNSFGSIKRLYAEYNVTPPLRANQHSKNVSVSSLDAAYDELTPELVWVPLNRAQRRQTGFERALVLSDIHVPFHDERAIAVVFAVIEDMRPDVIIIGGDLADFFSISKHTRNPLRKLQLGAELQACRGFLAELRQVAGEDCRIVYVQGNHEQRLETYLYKSAPELSMLDELTIESLLHLDECRIEYVKGKSETKTAYFQYGDIRIGHFDRLAPKSGYLAHRLMDTWRAPVIQGHSHRLAMVTYTDPDGKVIVGAESGCLCSLDANYVDAPNWCQGVVVITRWLDTDEHHIQVVPIVNHEAMYDSVIYSA